MLCPVPQPHLEDPTSVISKGCLAPHLFTINTVLLRYSGGKALFICVLQLSNPHTRRLDARYQFFKAQSDGVHGTDTRYSFWFCKHISL